MQVLQKIESAEILFFKAETFLVRQIEEEAEMFHFRSSVAR